MTTHSTPANIPIQQEWWSRGRDTQPRINELAINNSPPMSSSPAAMFLSGFTQPSSSSAPRLTQSPLPFRPAPDPDIVGGYSLGKNIGHGGFSTIRLATAINASRGSHPIAAVKIVRNHDDRPGAPEARRRLSHEAAIWKQLSHEHILPLFQTVETDYATYFFTLYCPEGSLLDIINSHAAAGGLVMDDAGMLFRQIVRGLRYLHEGVGLVHGDLKLENILVDESGSCRIADFGLARWINGSPNGNNYTFSDEQSSEEEIQETPSFLGSTRKGPSSLPAPPRRTRGRRHRVASALEAGACADTLRTFQPGSLPYAAPELLTPQDPATSQQPSPTQDMWALGCILYALLFGKLPFDDPFEPRLQMKIVRGIWLLPGGRGRSKAAHPRNRSTSHTRSGQRSRSSSKGRHYTVTSSRCDSSFTQSSSRSKSRGRSTRSPTCGSQVPRATSCKRIGRVAENVLKGCLCVERESRWTIAMVDEVGWGVGWDLDVEIEEDDEGDIIEPSMPSASSESSVASSIQSVFGPSEDPSIVIASLGNENLAGGLGLEQSSLGEGVDYRQIRSRSRGKRGKTSRSSSLVPSAEGITPHPSGTTSPYQPTSRSSSKERDWARGRTDNHLWYPPSNPQLSSVKRFY